MNAAAAALALALMAPQEPVPVRVPAGTRPAVAELLAGWFGGDVAVPAADASAPFDGVWLLGDEWTLACVAAAGGELLALPWADDVVLAADAAAFAGAGLQPTWMSVALAPALHDRLGLVGPEIDGAAWWAGCSERLGDGDDAVLALWTTLDARAGSLCGSVGALRDGLLEGRFVAALGPRGWFEALPMRSSGGLRLERMPGSRVRRGVALTAGAGGRARAIAVALLEPDRSRGLATAAGLDVVAVAPGVRPAAAQHLRQRFEAQVRGRGRAVEELADRLDLWFGAGFLVCALVLWRVLRRTPPP